MEKNSPKIIVSGIGPGLGGVGKYMEYLISKYPNNKAIYPKRVNGSNLFFQILKVIRLKLFRLRLRALKNENLIILSHNYLNIKTIERLINNNQCWLYLMDNNFFCIQSYNYNFKNKGECIRCIEKDFNEAFINGCNPQPLIRSKLAAIRFNEFLKEKSKHVHIVCLSKTNLELAKKHFIKARSFSYSYFITTDFLSGMSTSDHQLNNKYDLVFHGSDQEIKGVSYVIKLAKKLPNYSLFIPTTQKTEVSNIFTQNLIWENGLDNIVKNAKIVLSPSIWSNTPEAAVLKNIIYNGVCAIRNNSSGFNQEMPDDAFISLSGNLDEDAEKIKTYLIDESRRKKVKFKAQLFFRKYINTAESQIDKLIMST